MAIVIVLVIASFFGWWELTSHSPTNSVLDAGESSLKIKVGEQVPNFRLETPDDSELQLSDFVGRAVVLNFWATWCSPCRAEMPALQQIANGYGPSRELVVVGINMMESPEVVKSYTKELGLSFPMALDRKGVLAARYGLIGLPATFFIDADGILQAQALGQLHGELLQDGIDAVLGDQVDIP
tara:strand:- start:384 stop:932 length:549 start_codon:yes stop_codon:yes gene_type:complete